MMELIDAKDVKDVLYHCKNETFKNLSIFKMEGQLVLPWFYRYQLDWNNFRHNFTYFYKSLYQEEKQGYCFTCKKEHKKTYWHHIIYISRGGANIKENIIEVCILCHCKFHKFQIGRLNSKFIKLAGKKTFERLKNEYINICSSQPN